MPTTLTLTPSDGAPVPVRPLRFPTLLAVELRKMTDTRSARGLLAASVAATAGVLAWKVGHPEIETSFDNYSRAVATFVAFLTPLIGLLAMTSEWTQRTALSTFTLAPRRLPVIAAKYLAAVGLALAVLAVGLVLAFGATAIGGAVHGPASFGGALGDIRGAAVFVVLQVTMAAAFGALAANTPVALTAFLVAPTVWAVAAQGALRAVAPWFDVFEAYARLASGHPFTHLGQTLTALSVWVVAPAGVGLVRSLRREVK
jgi:ABC-type transport system involved in multi-copper enzyme maturation permease subunit